MSAVQLTVIPEVLPGFLPGPGALLFHAAEYLLVFLPVVVLLYFLLGRAGSRVVSVLWLLVSSLLFYAYWQFDALWLVAVSVLCNFLLGAGILRCLERDQDAIAGRLLAVGVVANLALLGYYKYLRFFVEVAGAFRELPLQLPDAALPLAISFFTFTQIAYLVDVRRGLAREYSLLNYALFVTYFPHLIAGPILHHKEMMPQFSNPDANRPDWKNIYHGVFLMAAGIIKKVVFADTLSPHVDAGFGQAASLPLLDAWMAALGYTLQLYFDFSGYTDMAIGASLMLNIRLPENFNSPYKATSIREFWLRWHMTLSRWLRDYLYIPLGGSRYGMPRTLAALLLTFLLGGLWHGAGWTFIVWGGLHGVAVCLQRIWQRNGCRMPALLAAAMTFVFVTIAWVFFRAESMPQALALLAGMAGLRGVGWDGFVASMTTPALASTLIFGEAGFLPGPQAIHALLLVLGLLVVWCLPNTSQCLVSAALQAPRLRHALATGALAAMAVGCSLFMHRDFARFIYFYF